IQRHRNQMRCRFLLPPCFLRPDFRDALLEASPKKACFGQPIGDLPAQSGGADVRTNKNHFSASITILKYRFFQ
ncbi:MAG: hypothetical protein KF686_06250, partial [Ramlibacter sp.]|nr:hypothetical protein [Ramlibacter sp.]